MTKLKNYRAGLIGCGRIGADFNPPGVGSSRIDSHAQAYAEHPRVELVAAFDIDESALRVCKKRWNVKHLYTDMDQMLGDQQLDIISISSPPQTHLDFLNRIMKSDSVSGILMEKPLASNQDDAESIVDLLKGGDIKVAMNYIRRYPPVYQRIKKDLQMEKYGEIQYVHVIYTKGVLNNASHAIDYLRYIFGEIENIVVTSPYIGAEYSEPTLSFRLRFNNGLLVDFTALDYRHFNIFEIDIFCSGARIKIGDLGHIVEVFPVEDTEQHYGFRQLATAPEVEKTMLHNSIHYAIQDLIESIEENREPICTLKDGHAAMSMALQILSFSKNKNFIGNYAPKTKKDYSNRDFHYGGRKSFVD